MKSRRSSALKSDRIGLSNKANKCSNAGTGDLGVLTIHETSPWFSLGDEGSTRPPVQISNQRRTPVTEEKVIITPKHSLIAFTESLLGRK